MRHSASMSQSGTIGRIFTYVARQHLNKFTLTHQVFKYVFNNCSEIMPKRCPFYSFIYSECNNFRIFSQDYCIPGLLYECLIGSRDLTTERYRNDIERYETTTKLTEIRILYRIIGLYSNSRVKRNLFMHSILMDHSIYQSLIGLVK